MLEKFLPSKYRCSAQPDISIPSYLQLKLKVSFCSLFQRLVYNFRSKPNLLLEFLLKVSVLGKYSAMK